MAPEPTTTHGPTQDRLLHAMLGRYTLGVLPAALALAPGKQTELMNKALRKLHRLLLYTAHAARGPCPACIEPLPQDTRFHQADWQRWPFNLY